MSYQPRLRETYRNEVVPALQKKFEYKSIMEVPRIEKIVISQGIGDAVSDKKLVQTAAEELMSITGQKVLIVNSKKDISNFKLR